MLKELKKLCHFQSDHPKLIIKTEPNDQGKGDTVYAQWVCGSRNTERLAILSLNMHNGIEREKKELTAWIDELKPWYKDAYGSELKVDRCGI